MWLQKTIQLPAKSRGFHLISHEILTHVPEIKTISTGILHVFLQHTSASLTLNENADPDVRIDLESYINDAVPEHSPYFLHTNEGDDDMPAHIKSSILGASLSIPVGNGRMLLGTWQGIYLCEHRNYGGKRNIVLTLFGE